MKILYDLLLAIHLKFLKTAHGKYITCFSWKVRNREPSKQNREYMLVSEESRSRLEVCVAKNRQKWCSLFPF